MSTLLDCLVKAGAIPDDCRQIVPQQTAMAIDCSKGRERVEVTIERIA